MQELMERGDVGEIDRADYLRHEIEALEEEIKMLGRQEYPGTQEKSLELQAKLASLKEELAENTRYVGGSKAN